jgi:hypothetical protein
MKTFLVFLINHREALGSFAWIRLDSRLSLNNLATIGYAELTKRKALNGYTGFSIRKGSKPSTTKQIYSYHENT